MQYYFLCCIATGPLFFILYHLPSYFRSIAVGYRFDDEGSMRWGILFAGRFLFNYSRIQDIHLVSNFVNDRSAGPYPIQTASGSATPEVTIEGLRQFNAVEFLTRECGG